MNKFKTWFDATVDATKAGIIKNSPEILVGLGIGCMLSSIYFAIKSTPEAMERKESLDEEVDKYEVGNRVYYWEVLKNVAPVYSKTMLTAGVGISLIGLADKIHLDRNAGLATAYALLDEYSRVRDEKLDKKLGPKKAAEVRSEIAQEIVDNHPGVTKEVYVHSDDEIVFLDFLSDKPFKSTINKMDALRNEINERLLSEHFISLREIYYEIPELRSISAREYHRDLDHTGFNLEDGLITWSYEPARDGDRPVFVWSYMPRPRALGW